MLFPPPPRRSALVVDDDPLVRALLDRWLSGIGLEVQLAGSVEEAVSMLRRVRWDVALLDVQMPGRDGIWLSNHIRLKSPGTHVVFVTANDELPASATLSAGVTGYLVKPVRREDLLALVCRILSGSEAAVSWHSRPYHSS